MRGRWGVLLLSLLGLVVGLSPEADAIVTRGLLCGINDYKYMGPGDDLEYSVADATNLYNLILGYGGSRTNVRVLLGGSASKRGIQSGIRSLALRARAGEVVLFYFSGHGSNDGEKTYICPYEATNHASMISEDELQLWLSAITAKGATVVVILDTCFSGGFLTKSLTFGGKERKARPKVWPGTLPLKPGRLASAGKSLAQPGFIVMTASSEDESSYEYTWMQGGVFTYFLRAAAAGPADDSYLADIGNDDGFITAEELFEALLQLSAGYDAFGYPVGFGSFGQTPQVSYGGMQGVELFRLK